MKRENVFNALFRPRSIVVVGGSESLSKPGGKVLRNIVDHGYRGNLWVVNPNATTVAGLPAFPSVADIPAPPELAIVAIPASQVATALEELARKGCRAVVILTSGFGEKDEKGREAEARLLAIAEKAGMTIIGPNCSGFMTPHYSGKFAGIIPRLRPRSVDFISGSGATVDLVMEQAIGRGLSFCNVVNVGNSVQIGVEDLVTLYDENYGPESAPILMLYLESLKKPALLLEHARNLSRKGCSVVGIKSGSSAAGARAAASHTGAMATNDRAVEALFRKAGIIRVKSKMELIDVACVLSVTGAAMRGNRACVITDAGGPGVMLTDELERQGFVLPVMRLDTQARLRRVLPPESSVANPIDCLPTRTASQIREVIGIVNDEEGDNIDVVAIQVANPGMSTNDEVYGEVSKAMDAGKLPIIPILTSVTTCRSLIDDFAAQGRCCFQDEVNMGAALGKVLRRPKIYGSPPPVQNYDRAGIGRAIEGQRGALGPHRARKVLEKAGFLVPRQAEVLSPDGLGPACDKVGYPLVMKVWGPLHKSDADGVRVGVATLASARSVWQELMAVEGAVGIILQQMVAGSEVILGASREDDLGHLIMFGLGGIYAEVLKDVSFALAPLAPGECLEMIEGIKGHAIIEGVRGRKGMSVPVLGDYLLRLSTLVTDFPAISEVDLNPVKGDGEYLYAVDGRIICR